MNSHTNTPLQPKGSAEDERLVFLLEGCALNSEPAFEELYALCSTQLFSVAMRILKIEAVAEEALQEAFIKIWQKAEHYAPSAGKPMTWMYSIARHQALDLLRRRSVREGNEMNNEFSSIAQIADESHFSIPTSDETGLLLKCLNKLAGPAQDCVVSAYCEGYSHEELSSRHNAPVSTVKSWIRRGLISLRACFDENT